MLAATAKADTCWRAARPCAEAESQAGDDVNCWAWYRCENEGDYVIKWRCDATESGVVGRENDTIFSLCADQPGVSKSFENCPPPVVCADDPNQKAAVITPEQGYLSTDLILVIAVVCFAVLAILLIIASSYKYWSLRRRFRFLARPGQYVLRDFPYPVRYHSLWGTPFVQSNYTTNDTIKRPLSTLSSDHHLLYPDAKRSRLNLVDVHGLRSQPQHLNTVSKSLYQDVYFSKHSSDTAVASRRQPRCHTISGYPFGSGNRGKNYRDSSSTVETTRPTGPFITSWRDSSCTKNEKDIVGPDTSEAAGSFVYHHPKGGANPSWRIVDQVRAVDSTFEVERRKGAKGKIGKGGSANGYKSEHSSTEFKKANEKRRKSGTCKIRGDGAGEWWGQRFSGGEGQPFNSGYSRSHSSDEHLHIHMGNLNTIDNSRSKSESRASSGADHPRSRLAAFRDTSPADVTKSCNAIPPNAKVSSIPYHDTEYSDMSAGKHVLRFTNSKVYDSRMQVGKPPLPNKYLRTRSNIYAELLDFSINDNHDPRTNKESTGHKDKSSQKNRIAFGKDTDRFLRVRGKVYEIVPTITSETSSNITSSNSLDSAPSCSGSGLSTAHRRANLDLSYDNFRDDHLRQLARRAGGVASSSTLDACTPPPDDYGEHSSFSSSDRERYRF